MSGENLSSANINIGSMNGPYDKTTNNTTISHIMNRHPHNIPPTNWDQQKEKNVYHKQE